MNRIESLIRRYAACGSLLRYGVEIISVGDPSGAAFNNAVRRLIVETREEDSGPWEELVSVSKAVRWRRLTQPQPAHENTVLTEGCNELARQVLRLHGAVAQESDLAALALAAEELVSSDNPVGDLVTRSIGEVGARNCVVVVASRAALEGIERWLRALGVPVLLAADLEAALGDVDLVYAIGPPRIFPSAMVTAPLAGEVTFITPAWFADVSLPRSALSRYAERAVTVRGRVSREGHAEPSVLATPEVDEEELQPTPTWTGTSRPDRHPIVTEVEARKVLLSGDLALWLDDGDRIRAVNPRQPVGERVIYVDVQEVAVGTYLLVRTGTTERRALYEAALGLLGPVASEIDKSQSTWKLRLSEQLSAAGYNSVVRALARAGVLAADRARAWTDPNLIRPHSDTDFGATLTWLGIAKEPAVTYANRLRRALYQASADIREQLETAVSRSDLAALDRVGSLSLEIDATGFRGILATRVLAVSPTTQIVQRREARVAFHDTSAKWLE